MANENEVQGVIRINNTFYRVHGVRPGDKLKERSKFLGMIEHNYTPYGLFGVPTQSSAPLQPNDATSSIAGQGNDVENEQSLNSKFATTLKIV